MATKQDVINQMLDGRGCLGKARDDEEVFVLVGDDMLAAPLVEMWARAASAHLGEHHPKVIGALQCAARMRQTPNRKLPD